MKEFSTEKAPDLSRTQVDISKSRRLPNGSSDPVSFTCTCPASSSPDGGQVLLFYRYFAASPALPNTQISQEDITSLASCHTSLTQKYFLGGKIRVAQEGFNITVAGTKESISAYIQACISHWSFSGLDLDTVQKQREFFKPTPGGCSCVFGGAPASVRVTAEITPMGVTNYLPSSWDSIEVLTPEEFHERCHTEPNTLLLDVRNHYESRIGYFVDPRTGEPALRPQIRRFSQWPQYVNRRMVGEERGERQILTFCTGGIRCEKGARFLQERTGERVATLKGGVAAYLMWMDKEIEQGRKRPEESLFKGRNFVFDARGSTTLEEDSKFEPVAKCHVCTNPSERLSKCRSKGCHLVLVVCAACELSDDPRCCQSCLDMDNLAHADENPDTNFGPGPICACEKEREADLWGEYVKPPKQQKTRKGTRKGLRDGMNMNIQVKVID
ncbi:Thiosulfate sulfurtransferase/rhodanese-like domain-containing protein 2 [Lachnellula cervina]|uniref:Thiosulfate sulfurtransferase/rhodanese-like domain-containing protein 2 n=1 Tax=Lachnellula cervina TaxID=1316786 RepID=A0A7D8YYV0_9HELO|nr:Thiosulfate sulfurtransferase/rhodanese-like domain-containing protein 2 [Lachnellula cervina]